MVCCLYFPQISWPIHCKELVSVASRRWFDLTKNLSFKQIQEMVETVSQLLSDRLRGACVKAYHSGKMQCEADRSVMPMHRSHPKGVRIYPLSAVAGAEVVKHDDDQPCFFDHNLFANSLL
jgi:hypothetical protein